MINRSDIFSFYRQFEAKGGITVGNADHNEFLTVDRQRIDQFEAKTNRKMPSIYADFLCNVGEGNYTVSTDGVFAAGYNNYFMGPEFIRDMIERKTYDWTVLPEFLADEDFPFFSLGNQGVYVLRNNGNKNDLVCGPFGYQVIAEDFLDFLVRLKDDSTFYNKIPFPSDEEIKKEVFKINDTSD